MPDLLQLFVSFFLVGVFGFGGGYAMIPLIRADVLKFGWMGATEFANLVAVSQMTPGPLAVNAATYAGMHVGGLWAAAVATIGVSLPSFVIVTVVAHFVTKFRSNRYINSALNAVRPATVGMIAAAVLFFLEMSVFGGNFKFVPGAAVIFLLSFLLVRKWKWNPVFVILLSAVLGILLI
jgi:chromate transporter